MAAVPWRDEFLINVSVIDEQHRELAERVNRLHRVLEKHQTGKKLKQVLDELIEFTELHFATEEELMRKYDYPEYKGHKAAHELLLHQLHAVRKAVGKKRAVAFSGADDLSADWVTRHLLDKDVPLGKFLNEQGIS